MLHNILLLYQSDCLIRKILIFLESIKNDNQNQEKHFDSDTEYSNSVKAESVSKKSNLNETHKYSFCKSYAVVKKPDSKKIEKNDKLAEVLQNTKKLFNSPKDPWILSDEEDHDSQGNIHIIF